MMAGEKVRYYIPYVYVQCDGKERHGYTEATFNEPLDVFPLAALRKDISKTLGISEQNITILDWKRIF